jgi:hypothetical protein
MGDSYGCVFIFLNTGTNPDGTPILDSGSAVKLTNGQDLCAGDGRAAAVYEDWNGDGDKDLVIGILEGGIKIYLNNSSNVFYYSTNITADGWAPVSYGYQSRSTPRFYDWDGDGLKDLLAGEVAGYVWYFRNVTENPATTPFVFNTAEKLLLTDGITNVRYTLSGSGAPRSRLYATDWNEDGLDDLVIGGNDGRLQLFLACLESVMIDDGSPYYYSTIQDAYDAALTEEPGDTIQIQSDMFTEDLNIDRDISVTLAGGYNCSYTDNPEVTTLNGDMIISAGTVTVTNLEIDYRPRQPVHVEACLYLHHF